MIRKNTNFTTKQYSRKLIAFSLLLVSFLFLSLTVVLSSCSASSPGDAGTSTAKDEAETKKITSEELEEAVKALEESKEEIIDYENVNAGAELKGFIPNYLCTDCDNYIKIEITNTSDFTWKKDGQNIVRIGYHYYGQSPDISDYAEYDSTARTSLPDDMKQGDTAVVEILINDIAKEGIYVLQIDLELKGHFWFSSKGVKMIEGATYFGPCSE